MRLQSKKAWDRKRVDHFEGLFLNREAPDWDFSRTVTGGKLAWWLLTLPRLTLIHKIEVKHKVLSD